MLIILLTFVFALGLGLYVTPLAARAAQQLGIVAAGDGNLRTQTEPVPYLGGVAIYLAMLIALAVAADFTPQMLGLMLGTTIMLMVGLIDDFGVMTAKMKLFGQVVAGMALIKGGVVLELDLVRNVTWPGDMPLLAWALSLLWLIGVANAVNFLDIEDGLAGGVCAAAMPALFAVAFWNGRTDIALYTAALFGATVGFLRYNAPFPQARIYLGDAGSLFLGTALAALAMIGSYTGKNNLAAVSPVIILGVPCFEIVVTVLARLRRGIPVWLGSPDHVVRRMHRAGVPKRTATALMAGTSLVLGGIAVLIMRLDIQSAMIAVGAVGLVAVIAAALVLRVKVDWRPKGEAK